MNIGIIQGRLSPPDEGFQECPKDWQREIELLPSLGLTHVEWIVTKENFSNNPIFSSRRLPADKISSVCADFFVDPIFNNFTTLGDYMDLFCDALTSFFNSSTE